MPRAALRARSEAGRNTAHARIFHGRCVQGADGRRWTGAGALRSDRGHLLIRANAALASRSGVQGILTGHGGRFLLSVTGAGGIWAGAQSNI